MNRISVIAAAVVAAITINLNAQTVVAAIASDSYETRLTTMAHRPWMAEEITNANLPLFIDIISVASQIGDSLQDYTVLSRVNRFVVAPTADDPNFQEICQLVNLAKLGNGLKGYIVNATTNSMIGSPAPAPRPAAPAQLTEWEKCLSSANSYFPNDSKRANEYAKETYRTIKIHSDPEALAAHYAAEKAARAKAYSQVKQN